MSRYRIGRLEAADSLELLFNSGIRRLARSVAGLKRVAWRIATAVSSAIYPLPKSSCLSAPIHWIEEEKRG